MVNELAVNNVRSLHAPGEAQKSETVSSTLDYSTVKTPGSTLPPGRRTDKQTDILTFFGFVLRVFFNVVHTDPAIVSRRAMSLQIPMNCCWW